MRYAPLGLQGVGAHGAHRRPVHLVLAWPPAAASRALPVPETHGGRRFTKLHCASGEQVRKCVRWRQEQERRGCFVLSRDSAFRDKCGTSTRDNRETSLLCKRYNFHIRSPCINPLQKMEVQKPHLSNGWHVSLLTTWQDPRRALPTQNQRKLRRNFASWKDFLFFALLYNWLATRSNKRYPNEGPWERLCTGGGASLGPGSAANCLCDSQRIF